tara:strand:- start:392 stop:619 length:228 start_codon:yes stop_codon:yes gene_type:complete
MKFPVGQNKMNRGGVTYIKDTIQNQVDPPKEEKKQFKEKITPKDEGSIQHEQVVQKSILTGSKPKRRGRPKGGKK